MQLEGPGVGGVVQDHRTQVQHVRGRVGRFLDGVDRILDHWVVLLHHRMNSRISEKSSGMTTPRNPRAVGSGGNSSGWTAIATNTNTTPTIRSTMPTTQRRTNAAKSSSRACAMEIAAAN